MSRRLPYPDRPLGDGAVVLRRFGEADVPRLVELCRDPEIPRWTNVPSPYTEQDAREYVSGAALPDEVSLAVAGADDDELLGAIGVRDLGGGRAEIGYWVGSAARRRQVGTRAVRLAARWALRELGMERLELLTHPENEASQRLALRAGFTRERTLRVDRDRRGRREDRVVFSLLGSQIETP